MSEFDYELFRENLKQFRLELGYSQALLGRYVGITDRNIGEIERGKQKPSLTTVIHMLNTFKVTYDEFMKNELDSKSILIDQIDKTLSTVWETEKTYILKLLESIDSLD